jgi:hypothetical protein
MFKKNSWIVALVLALAVTALFTGCIEALEPEVEVTYTEVKLGDFNAWGGQAYQKGWAVAGIKFDGAGDKQESAADLGYKNDDFAAATRLVIEMPDDSYPKGNIDLIWGAEKAGGVEVTRWRQTGNITRTKEGNILTINLTKMAGYAEYKDPSITKRKLVIQAGGDDMSKLVKSAKLLIPDSVPYVAVTDVTLASASFLWTNNFTLAPTVTPDDATNQLVYWSIKSWTPPSGSGTLSLPALDTSDPASVTAYNAAKAALLAKVDFTKKTVVIRPAQPEVLQPDYEYWDYSVLPPVKVTVDGDGEILIPEVDGQSVEVPSSDTIYAVSGEAGTVVLVATILNGKAETGTAAVANFTKEFTVTIADPFSFAYKLGTTNMSTIYWGGAANAPATSTVTVASNGATKYTVDFTGNSYGNAYHYVRYDLGSGKTIGDYTGMTLTYKSVSGDGNFKDVRVKAMATAPTGGYNPGIEVARFATGDAIGATGAACTVTFGNNGANVDAAFQGNVTTAEGYGRYIYLWFLPWSNAERTVIEISDVVFTPAP